MHHESLLLDLAVCLAAALCCGWMANRLRFSPIVGYLVAGIICGSFTPGYVAEPAMAEQLADIGVVLLMFGVGLHFKFQGLFAIRRVALPGALVQSLVTTAVVNSIMLNPFLFRNLLRIEHGLRKLPQWQHA
jgi:monovalent cation:H+ antiporter-2, CPA2 family